MTFRLVSFCMRATDMPRAQTFYRDTFGVDLTNWTPSFAHASGDDPGSPHAPSLSLVPATDGVAGLVVAVDDVASVLTSAAANGGRILDRRMRINGEPWAAKIADTEGNELWVIPTR